MDVSWRVLPQYTLLPSTVVHSRRWAHTILVGYIVDIDPHHLGSPLSKAGVSTTFLSPNGLSSSSSSSSSGSESDAASRLTGAAAGLGGCGGGAGSGLIERPERSGAAEVGEDELPVGSVFKAATD